MARILVAQDSAVTAEMISVRLGNAGHDVVRAENGPELLDHVAQLAPDLILLDVMLPELDGLQVLRKLKQDPLTGVIPVVVLSARSQEADVLTALGAGAADYVTKPFSFPELSARLDRILSDGPEKFRITVRDVAGKSFAGELVSGDPVHVAARFHREDCPDFAIGDSATLSLHSPSRAESIELRASVCSRSEAEPWRSFRFRLDERESSDGSEVDAFLRLIGRRGTFRLHFGTDEFVEATVTASDQGEIREIGGRLENLSATGARILLKGAADQLLHRVDAFTLRFHLHDCDTSVEIEASIRHREISDEGVFYGVRFQGGDPASQIEAQDAITDYIIARQCDDEY